MNLRMINYDSVYNLQMYIEHSQKQKEKLYILKQMVQE
ncbi:hypothetical protein SAMN05216498_2505 [Tenuibacillus multivorans]|uniref:Uncharacterized protein n=1 Tax=Tenuibacillus multivorans TaxID=237069 RepID=A0A1H0C4C2_9BACI|nr:hypothetical protein SAMN05216498_2505 [Tenuibacillus multivorans]